MANIRYNNEQIIELHKKGLTDKEMAEIIGCTNNQMAKKRARLGLQPNKNKKELYSPTKEELGIIVGTLLGDSTVRYVHNECKYPNLTFCHCVQQKEYFEWKAKKLYNFMSSTNEYRSYRDYNILANKNTARLVFTGMNMACLVNIRDEFYPEGQKIIPIEYIKKHFNALSLYCWYMDDGSYDKSSNSFILNTQAFTRENLQEFVEFLKDKFNLEFNIKKDNSLYLKHISNDIFVEILKNIHECTTMDYKLGRSSLNSVKQGNPLKEGNPVLNLQETEENAERLGVMPNE